MLFIILLTVWSKKVHTVMIYVIKKDFNKKLAMTKKMMKILKTVQNFGFSVMFMLMMMLRDICHINGKYTGSAHRNCNTKVKVSNKIPVLFHKLKNYASHLITQELGKFNFKINVITNWLWGLT